VATISTYSGPNSVKPVELIRSDSITLEQREMSMTTSQPFTGPLRRRFGAALDAPALVPLLASARLPTGTLDDAPTLAALRRRAE
jgi:hypothetical protein